MQFAEAKGNNSLLLALRQYGSAVSNMEETVLLPSLLRDVPTDEAWECEASEPCRDLYENYLMLKGIRTSVESSLVHLDDRKDTAMHKILEPLMETDPEAIFHFHLKGLFCVMRNLTEKTQSLTDKYMDIVRRTN